VLIVSAAWLLVYLFPVLLILVASLMIVGTLNPAVQWLEGRRIRKRIAIAIIFSVLFLAILLFVTLTIPALIAQVTSLIEQEPELRARIVKFLASYQITASFADTLRNFQYGALIESSGPKVFAFSRRLLEIIAYSAGAIFLALYIMIDGDRLRGAAFALVPRSHHIRLSRILINLQTIVGGYLRGQLITCLFMGLFLFALLKACGIPNAMAFALFGGIADVLPFIGIFLTIGPAVLAALSKGPVITTIVLVALLCYEEFESRFLIPFVYGRALRLPSSVVLFSLITGGTLYGIVGALLALPMAATILMLIDELRVELPGEEMQDEDLKLKKKDERSEAEYIRRTEGMPVEEAAAVAVEISNSRRNDKSGSRTKTTE
jgi:predicted PurR-regulated permease PerM